ncbi:MAG: HindVP family restriction endonuclease [Hymenobacter sp.]
MPPQQTFDLTAGVAPGLFGLNHSNRNFTHADSWGKNQFNSSFPAALVAYMGMQGLNPVYLKLGTDLKVYHSHITTTQLYGMDPLSPDIFYAFESPYTPYQPLISGTFPRTDLVTINQQTGTCLRGLEVKLTALPDNTTCNLSDDRYGSELVVRPDTIVYLACSLAMHYRADLPALRALIGDGFAAIENWREGIKITAAVRQMVDALDRIALAVLDKQEPVLLQPVWKTVGKSPQLAQHCLDVFVWSDLAFTQLFLNVARRELNPMSTPTRQVRTVVWLFKMLYDFSFDGKIDHRSVIDGLTYDTKNDKAFAVSGQVTNPYMRGAELTQPRITKDQIREIILGGGQQLLSPERRFDAIIFNSPELFTQIK